MLRFQFTGKQKIIFENNELPSVRHLSTSRGDDGWNSPLHIHSEDVEIAFIEHGIAYYNIEMRSVVAKSGEVVIIDSGTMHAVDYVGSSTSIWVIHADDFQISGLPPNKLLLNQEFRILDLAENLDFVKCLFHEFEFLAKKRGEDGIPIFRCGNAMLFSLLYDIQEDKDFIVPEKYSCIAKDIMLYLNNNYKDKLTLEEIAKEFHISPSHLSHEFTKFFSISPINYLINRRICEAKWMLISTDISLEKLAESLGYNNISHFKNTFKSKTGHSPSEYRKLYSENNDSNIFES